MYQRLLKLCFAAAVVVSASAIGHAQIDTHSVGDMGYLSTPMESAEGLVLTNNRYSEIYTLNGNTLKPILQGRNCGLYTNMSKDGKFIGFKSFNENDEQAPAIVNVATGEVTLLEDYSHECGQVSFSDDGTMAYTVGSNLIVRKGLTRQIFNLGFYTNIANISPDGKHVAYSSIEGEMFMINLDTKVIENIAVTDGYQPIWSPDGQKIAIHVTNGTISVLDRPSMRVHNLGEGQSVSWANNSKELIFTKIDRKNELEVMGSSIKKVNFDGTEECTLVATSDNMPSGAILTKDNNLIIPYQTGVKRGLSLKKMPTEITPASLSSSSLNEISIISFGEDKLVGARLQDPCENPNYKNTQISASFEQKIGAMDIPYLSQVYDVPYVNGCALYGYVACAPTTASMYLGYYGLLDKVAVATRATTNVSTGAYTYYAYHVGKSYTNQKGTYTFSSTATGNGCSGVQGGYGYMWYGNYTPRDRFTNYMTLNGCTSSAMQWNSSTSWTKFKEESTAGRPTMLCIALQSSGHLILGFATNCKYRTATGFTSQSGSFVCHDPYGDCNDSSWADNDGQHSTYDWVGYNNGQANIGTFYYSCTAVPPASSVTPVEKKITANPTSVTLSAEYGAAVQPYTDVTIKGENLTQAMSVNSLSSVITATKQSDWNDLTGGTLRLTLNTNFSLGAGVREGYVAVQSGNPDNGGVKIQINFTATLTDSSTDPGTDPGTEPNPNPNPSTDNVTSLTEVWNFSEKSGKTADWITNGSQVTQDMAFKDGKLYVVHRKVDNTDNKIYIVDAYTGSKLGELPTSSCTSGTYYLSSIENFGGKIIAANLATGAESALMVYAWNDDSSEPTVLLNTTEHNGLRCGDALSVSGDMTNGKIWFGNATSVWYYTVTNGTCSTTPTIINLTNSGAAYTNSSHASENITVESDGSFWVDSKDYTPAHFNASGSFIETTSAVHMYGTDIKFITLGSKKYAAVMTYANTTNTLTEASFKLLDATNGIGSATEIASYPVATLGTSRNTSFRNTLCYEVNDTDFNIWVLVPYQGAAYYKFQHTTTSGIEDVNVVVEEEAPAVYYNLQGVPVVNPENGIYIRVQGGKATKVLIR